MTRRGIRPWAVVGAVCATSLAALGFEQCQSGLAAAAFRHALLAFPGLSVGTVGFDSSRDHLVLDHVLLTRPGLRVSLGHVDVPSPATFLAVLMGPAVAQTGAATAQDIRIETPKMVISVPRIEARGTPLSSVELAALFDSKGSASLGDRLAKLSFEALTAPEVTIAPLAVAAEGNHKGLTFHNLALSQGVAGKIKSVEIERTDLDESKDGTPAGSVETGKIVLSNVDLPLTAEIQTGTRTDAQAPLRPIYDSVSVEAIRLRSPADGDIDIGSVRGQGFKGRPLLMSFGEISRIVDEPPAERSDSDREKLAAYGADVITSFSSERVEMRDFGFTETKAGAPVTLKIGSFAIDGYEGTKLRSVALADFSVVTKQADVSLARASLDGLEEPGLPNLFKQQFAPPDQSPSPVDVKALGLKLNGVSLQALHVEVPADDGTGNSADGRKNVVDMPEFQMHVGRFAANIPADMTIHSRMTYDVAPNAPADPMQNLVRAGFAHFDLSTDYAMRWDETAGTVTIDRLSFDAKDMASVTLGATASNVSNDLVNGDRPAREAAARQVRLRGIDIGVANAGLAEKALPLIAAASSTSVPLLKAELIGQIDAAVAETLGTGPVPDQLTTAITSFINQPKNLTISIKAPGGIDLDALNAITEPKDLLALIEISAVANR